MVTVDLTAERAAVLRFRDAWINELDRLGNLLNACRDEGSSPPANYWQAERLSRLRYEAARAALDALS